MCKLAFSNSNRFNRSPQILTCNMVNISGENISITFVIVLFYKFKKKKLSNMLSQKLQLGQ